MKPEKFLNSIVEAQSENMLPRHAHAKCSLEKCLSSNYI